MDWCVSLRPAISPERLWSNSVFSLTNVGSGNCAAALWGPIFYTVLEEKMKKLETCLIWIKKVVLGINGCKHISHAPLISKLRYRYQAICIWFQNYTCPIAFPSGKNKMSRLLLSTAEKCTVRSKNWHTFSFGQFYLKWSWSEVLASVPTWWLRKYLT